MSTQENATRTPTPTPTPRRRGKMAAVLVAVFAVGAIGGGTLVMATDAWSHGARWMGSMGHHGWGHGGRGGGPKGHRGDPEQFREHMQDRALFALDRMVDLTDEQRESIRGIVGEVAGELAGAMEEHRELRLAWITELERADLDAGGLETLRAKHLALADRKSRKALEAVLAVGAVLTPEQRSELVSELHRHRGRHGHHWRKGRDES